MVSNDNNNLIDMYWGQFDLLFVKQTEREKKENKESLLSLLLLLFIQLVIIYNLKLPDLVWGGLTTIFDIILGMDWSMSCILYSSNLLDSPKIVHGVPCFSLDNRVLLSCVFWFLVWITKTISKILLGIKATWFFCQY